MKALIYVLLALLVPGGLAVLVGRYIKQNAYPDIPETCDCGGACGDNCQCGRLDGHA